jgi:hypothetical protein
MRQILGCTLSAIKWFLIALASFAAIGYLVNLARAVFTPPYGLEGLWCLHFHNTALHGRVPMLWDYVKYPLAILVVCLLAFLVSKGKHKLCDSYADKARS